MVFFLVKISVFLSAFVSLLPSGSTAVIHSGGGWGDICWADLFNKTGGALHSYGGALAVYTCYCRYVSLMKRFF